MAAVPVRKQGVSFIQTKSLDRAMDKKAAEPQVSAFPGWSLGTRNSCNSTNTGRQAGTVSARKQGVSFIKIECLDRAMDKKAAEPLVQCVPRLEPGNEEIPAIRQILEEKRALFRPGNKVFLLSKLKAGIAPWIKRRRSRRSVRSQAPAWERKNEESFRIAFMVRV
ncbi:hypothetical protein [Dethiosulfatarculus sandiegensis]|uniref:Uncharacterized protein n=1 Tax=Dethiosulfatarculus sandiegensis TaxID=1429043 RepID=A0A0D2JE28_9BACT|nr:hypothetical protein [Dethiosulfatarculus sandiegensis]KIX13901.1 hypothetical protein X474_11995 [Dethiosulfatarculus sandiegensis]